MNTIIKFLAIVILMSATHALACVEPASVCFKASDGNFPLITSGRSASVIIESTADTSVQHAIKTFAKDLKRVSGRKAQLNKNPKRVRKTSVLIGVQGQSPLIDELQKSGKLVINDLKGQWEAYHTEVIKNPWPGVEKILVIVGSDRRGAIYGTYDISEQMGVSPWYWFADVPTTKRQNVYITAGSHNDKPKIRYRGIFINDEDPALSGWAKKMFGGVNAGMYEHVFELMLRLKANYLWPAMWSKAFHVDDPKNTVLADEMGIVVGASHHEPMTRAHTEWHQSPNDPSIGGPWNYKTNAANLRKFWRGGIERMMSKGDGKGYDSLITVGMRGDGDEPMSKTTAINLLTSIVNDQRKIIADVTKKPAAETPQVWALYKEVQEYYDQGMTVPDDITLLFADDNWGQIRRLPTKDLDRSGGYGVYYHFDYVGVPRNYKWLNTVQIQKVWQQMDLAYERGARNIWVVNVGDIKPAEFPLDFFLKMAWNPERMTVEALAEYPQKWAEQTFGKTLAPDIAELVIRYSNYAAQRKPELINENTFAIGEGIGEGTDMALKRGEFSDIVERWRSLEDDMNRVKARLKPEHHPAFFQLLEYPIAAFSNLYEMYFSTAWNRRLASRHDARANYFLNKVERAFARDIALTNEYHSLNNGKWDGMMNQVHMNYVIWNSPTQQTMPSVTHVAEGRNDIEVVFAPKNKIINNKLQIEASAYSRAIDGAGLSWTAIPNLGQSKASMITLPQGTPPTKAKDGVRLEYTFTSQNTVNITATIQLVPTLDTLNNNGVRVGLSIDDGPVKTVISQLTPTGRATNTPAKKAWYDAVVRNQHSLKAEFNAISAGEHVLKIWRLDDNAIFETVEIDFAVK